MAKFEKVHFKLTQSEDGYPPIGIETLWAKSTETAGKMVLDNIPFFSYDATIGDVINVRNYEGRHWFDKVVRRSENSLIRVVFFNLDCLDEVNKTLNAIGCSTEFVKSYKILAVSIPACTDISEIQKYLRRQSEKGRLDFEEPILRQ